MNIGDKVLWQKPPTKTGQPLGVANCTLKRFCDVLDDDNQAVKGAEIELPPPFEGSAFCVLSDLHEQD